MVLFTFMNYVYVPKQRIHLECLIICLRKTTSEIELEFLGFFTFINFFIKTLIKSIIYCQTVSLDYSYRVNVMKILCQASLPAFVLNLSKSGNISFRSIPNGNCLFSSASLSLAVGDNSLTGA